MIPDVSIVIPTFNRAALVERAIQSVREPDLVVEIIVVDDGSTDETSWRLRDRHDIKYIRLTKNQGQAAARNRGIEIARAPLVAFLDSDDIRVAGSLRKQLERLERDTESVLVHGAVRRLDDPELSQEKPCRLPEGDVYPELLRHNVIAPSTAVLRAGILLRSGGFNPTYRRSEEWDLWLRLCSRRPVCAVLETVVLLEPAVGPSHASGDPVLIEWTSARVMRNHLRSSDCRGFTARERRRIYREFRRIRIDMMIWKTLSRRSLFVHRLRCLVAAAFLDPLHMFTRANLKNLVKLLASPAYMMPR